VLFVFKQATNSPLFLAGFRRKLKCSSLRGWSKADAPTKGIPAAGSCVSPWHKVGQPLAQEPLDD
jgi:hypothetical protein